MAIRVKITGTELSAHTSKASEIEVLKQIAAQFKGTQTYLEMLFTPDFVDWVSARIKDDVSADMCADLLDEMKEHRESETRRTALVREHQILCNQFKSSDETHRFSMHYVERELREKSEALEASRAQVIALTQEMHMIKSTLRRFAESI